MKKIKEIKIINQDESTEIANIGADAQNVDYNNTTVKDELDKLNVTDNSLINTQANQGDILTSLQSQVSSLASGSPAGVYATVAALTSADPDHSKIYVVTENGHWYYYNNGWQDGGEYQATILGKESVAITNTTFFKNTTILPIDNWIIGKVYNTAQGYEQSFDGCLNREYQEVEPGEQYILVKADTSYNGELYMYCYDENKNFLANSVLSFDHLTIQTIPDNVHYVRYSWFHKQFTKVDDIKVGLIKYEDFLANYNINTLVTPIYPSQIITNTRIPYIYGVYGQSTSDTIIYNEQKIIISGNSQDSDTRWMGPIFKYWPEQGDILTIKLSDLTNLTYPDEMTLRLDKNIKPIMTAQKTELNEYNFVINDTVLTAIGEEKAMLVAMGWPAKTETTFYSATFEISLNKTAKTLDKYLEDIKNNFKETEHEMTKKINSLYTYNDFSTTYYSNKLYLKDGAFQDFDGGACATCDVSYATTAKISGFGWNADTWHYWLYAFKDKKGNFIEKHEAHDTSVSDLIVEIPENAKTMYVNGKTSNIKLEIESYLNDFEKCYDILASNQSKPEYKAMYLGDSITALGGDRAWYTYFNQIINVTEYQNIAVIGATLVDKNGTIYDGNPVFQGPDNNVNNVLGNQVQKIINNQETYITPDFILIAIGTNGGINTDKNTAYSAYYNDDGSIKDINTVDRKTAAGAFRYCSEKLHELYPNAMIVWCTPIHAVNTTRNAKDIMTYADNLKMLCDLGSYYCIDTIKCGINGLHEISDQNGEDLFDGLHPNAHGAKKMGTYNACKFKEFLNRIDAYKE